MKVCAVQMAPTPGNITRNLEKHLDLIALALECQARVVCFPELSLTGFEPTLAESLAVDPNDELLDVFQKLSDGHGITIAIGMPVRIDSGIRIGLLWFSPHQERQLYCKQQLHSDEYHYFEPGTTQSVFEEEGYKITPAICFESVQMDHADCAAKLGSELYLVSVAKSSETLSKSLLHYAEVSKKYGTYVLMANCVGPSDDFISAGQSAAWNQQGEILGKLNTISEGMVCLDLKSGKSQAVHLDEAVKR